MLSLRPYQREAIDAVTAAWRRGMVRPAEVLFTGAGKTVIFSHLSAEWLADNPGRRVLIIVHTQELLDQALQKLRSVAPGLRVGAVQAQRNETLARVIVATVQTLRSARRRAMIRDVGLVIVDECFPAGTMVGDKRIEDLRTGDLVRSWDEQTGREVLAPVVQVMSRTPESLVWVDLDDDEFVCTPNHPVLTTRGWVPAGSLQRGELVVSFVDANTTPHAVRRVPESGHVDDAQQDQRLDALGSGVLRRSVSGYLGESRSVGAHGEDEPRARVGADAGQQSNVAAGAAGEDERDATGDQAPAGRAWWQRGTDAGAASSIGGVPGVADRGRRGAAGWSEAVSLQGGHSSSSDEGGRRGGRGIPLRAGAPRLRPAPGRETRLTRVADVQVLQPGRDGTYGGVCSDGLVYNLEVAGTHTYEVARGVVVHNCHHAVATSYREVLSHFGVLGLAPGEAARAVCVGYTATMTRADQLALGDIWQDVIYSRTIQDGIGDGFLVRPRGVHVQVDDLDLSKVRTSAGDYRDGDLGQAIEASMAPEAIAKAVTEHADQRKILLFAPTVSSAGTIADALSASGRSVGLIHGALPQTERKAVLSDYRAGNTQILANCMVLTEGFDEPAADCVVLARPTKSQGLYIQIAGRVLRPYPGKSDALILDVVGATKLHGLVAGIDLFGEAPKEPKDPSDEYQEDPDELDEGQQDARQALGVDGPLVSTEVDLFAASSSRWLRTRAGVFFIPAGDRYIAILPSPPQTPEQWHDHFAGRGGLWGYDVVTMHKNQLRTEKAIVRAVPDLSYAMAWAEGDVTPSEKVTAAKGRSWQAAPPTKPMRRLAEQLRIYIPPGARQGEVSNMITLALATKRIDGHLPAYLRGTS